ncbi:MAG TPA: hypothetical protein VKH64_00835 [Candidatus Binatia bacterium]|nr:hypothetical protein [Candidatus Binatia bacterium]
MERIVPVSDHLKLRRYAVGQEIDFRGRRYKILKHTTLASGEAAVVLAGDKDQFIVGAGQFLAHVGAQQ